MLASLELHPLSAPITPIPLLLKSIRHSQIECFVCIANSVALFGNAATKDYTTMSNASKIVKATDNLICTTYTTT